VRPAERQREALHLVEAFRGDLRVGRLLAVAGRLRTGGLAALDDAVRLRDDGRAQGVVLPQALRDREAVGVDDPDEAMEITNRKI